MKVKMKIYLKKKRMQYGLKFIMITLQLKPI
nr:MAG TPA: hypothetical protein [Crassvirales sp.]